MQRCENFASLWQQLLEVEKTCTEVCVNANHKIENDAPVPRVGGHALASATDVYHQLEDMINHVETLWYKLDKSVQHIVELRADVSSIGDQVNAVDGDCYAGPADLDCRIDQVACDVMELTDLSASKITELDRRVQEKIDSEMERVTAAINELVKKDEFDMLIAVTVLQLFKYPPNAFVVPL